MKKLEQFFIDRNSSKATQDHYKAAVKLYEGTIGKTLDELIDEADAEEEDGIRWKRRKLKTYLMEFRNHLYANKAQGTARQYFVDIQTIYRHFEIELQPLPTLAAKSVDKTYELDYDDILTKEEIIDAYYEATNVVKCIILLASSSGLSKVDLLNLTVSDFIKACGCKNDNLAEQLDFLKHQHKLIPCFKGTRQKTNKSYITFCSPEATEHIVQYLIGRNAEIQKAYEQGESIESQLNCDDKLFDISNSHLSFMLRNINDKLNLGKVGKNTKFRMHMLRKFHSTTLINIENGFTVEEVDTLQGRSQDKTHRAYFHNSREKLYNKYLLYVDELMLFSSLNDVTKEEYEKVKKENEEYNKKLGEQQKTIEKIIENQKQLEAMLGL